MSAADVVRIQPETGPRTEELRGEQADTPQVGRWYYVKQDPEKDNDGVEQTFPAKLGCVTRLGSNYVEVTYVGTSGRSRSYTRIHEDIFWKECEFVADPEALLRGNAEKCRRELDGLMEDVKLLTGKLGVAGSLSLGAGDTGGVALALASSAPAAEYKTALVKAKEETLPALFEAIKEKSEELATWLQASLIPMRAEAEALEPAIARVEDRIFHVELYAGLCEEVTKIKDGAPADLTEPVHLFQRRLYMDEECLANYETGGMEFKDLRAFDRWLCRKDNLERVLPFPRTVVSFQVRRRDKERECAGFREFVQMLDDKKLDKLTFLYIRNGQRVYRLSTEIEFGTHLFPDLDHPVMAAGEGRLYASCRFSEWSVITEDHHKAMLEREAEEYAEYERKAAAEAKKPEKDREHHFSPDTNAYNYEPFTRESVHYDDILKHLRAEMQRHNRIVLVLQGLLDRSEALHPHPPWRLFEAGGFSQALALHRDADRTLAAGDKPDFEAYRARVNASIAVGSVTIGQEEAWLLYEGRKESARRDGDSRWNRVEYRPSKWHPEGDSGPGRFARVARLTKDGRAHYRWQKDRAKGGGPPVGRAYACKVARVLNVDGYQPGDYKQFFNDPRTREEYLQWAPLLLAAEEYKAGKFGEAAAAPEKPKPLPRDPGGSSEYRHLVMLRSYLGKAVRLVHPVTTKGGTKYARDTLWRVVALSSGEFEIRGLNKDGTLERPKGQDYGSSRAVRGMSWRDFAVVVAIAVDPTYAYKREKRKRVRDADDADEDGDQPGGSP